ncbi:FYVE, RhoGEF and PH domain-containing protein 3 isoform X9 [Taeniopygia guttata]|nr:FYVE, RhoGEF and PH domain-containing protein 3 isoform X7 [Taeniopygia guttata]XP_030139349.1 FYVE, RhoGEF and PH domain-containing protein 3 isoform X7 [Taeniopygia guttata]XP_030139350.1 FYVE, RhoGEF and PH domain-containing protein 3 isoform X7 [Taeniopygia guttata]XP_030139352.1 FYVE, RhoGEF and PH domain-containing protein 3 isoform X7 [Taeniopygia guttata]XP_041574718.1 FYVE, RhoGEF and PH domain-containing protein 3 isoform X7 [Taeniopygia guttata]
MHPLQKPQVPPKPVHLKPGQERIPPAPSRPLPADPKSSRSLAPGEEEIPISAGVNTLIEKFESIRQPVHILQRNQLNLALKMEPGLDSSKQTSLCDCDTVVSSDSSTNDKTELDEAEPNILCSTDLTNSDIMKIKELSIGDNKSHEDCTVVTVSKESQVELGTKDSTAELNGNGKIPNRDSGIDSPSCSVAGETFPSEEGAEQKKPSMAGNPGEMEPDRKGTKPSSVEQKRDSMQDDDSDIDEGSSEEQEIAEVPKLEYLDVNKCTEPQKLFNIANELLHTEEAYVKRLHLLDQVFCTKLSKAGISSEVITGIFSNISSIYCFHGQFLLPELKTRITQEWSVNPRLGDILQKLAPFLKMYGEYVKNFDRAMDIVNTCMQRSSSFKDVVQNIQKQEVCGNLTLQHHMLEPVQRIPRYELLLKDYLKKLPEESPDRKDAEKSLELISTAANHSNAAIRKMEKMHKLLEVYERLGGEEDIVNPANELIKEGHIQKLSAKNGTAQDRYLFLFNSMVLYCVPKLRLIGQKFSVREKMDIAGLQVQEIAKQNVAHTFSITGKKRSLELQARTEEEKREWIHVIQATIEKHKQNSETFRAFNSSFSQEEDHPPDSSIASTSSAESMPGADGGGALGGSDSSRKSSKSKRDKEKQSCKSCGESFNSITKRRHHCKQCGAVICAKCSEFKPLADNSRHNRVCKECFLQLPASPCSPGVEAVGEQKKRLAAEKQGILMAENSLFSSYLQFLEKGKTWYKMWVTIPKSEPLVLYLQGSSQATTIFHLTSLNVYSSKPRPVKQDGRSPRPIPLPGYEVSLPGSGEKFDMKHVFKLCQSHQTLYFSAEDEELQIKWMEILTKAAKGETEDTAEGLSNP